MAYDDDLGDFAALVPQKDEDMGEFASLVPKPSAIRRVADIGISGVKSAVNLVESGIGIADLVTGGQAGKLAESAGIRTRDANTMLDEMYSPQQQAANAAVADAKGFVPTVQALVQNPSVIGHTVIESVAPMLAGGLAARGAQALGAGRAVAGGIGEGIVGAGSAAEQNRQENPEGLLTGKGAIGALASGAGTAFVGAAGNKIADIAKVANPDTFLLKGAKAAGDAIDGNIVGRIAKGAGVEAGEELAQSMWEQGASNFAQDKPLGQGVPEAGAIGMLAGAVMGGGMASISGKPAATQEQAPAPQGNEAPTQGEAVVPEAGAAPIPIVGPLSAAAAMVAPEAPGARPFPFSDKAAATAQAAARTRAPGQPFEVTDNPDVPGRFAVMPVKVESATTEIPDGTQAQKAPETVQAIPQGPAPLAATGAAVPATPVDQAAHQAAASPLNDKPEPTKAQILAGVAALGHPKIGPLSISIETPAGAWREDKANDPPKWRTQMKGVHYGYVKRTEAADSTEAKRQGVDVFIKEGTPEDYNGPVYVVDQANKDGAFDEHKSVVGAASEAEARVLYLGQYEQGWTGLGAISAFPSVAEFNTWVKNGKKTEALSPEFGQAAPAVPAPAAAAPAVQVEPAGGGETVAAGAAEQPDGALAPTGSIARAIAGDSASWVIREKGTGKVIMETFDQAKVKALNTAKYEAVPILEHLQSLNKPAEPAAVATGQPASANPVAPAPEQPPAAATPEGEAVVAAAETALSEAQRTVLVEALGEDFERSYQQDIKDAILEKRGMKPAAREQDPRNTPLRTFLRGAGTTPQLAADITGERGLRANQRLPNTFRKGGLQLDQLVERAVEGGFLSRQEVEADSVDASNRLIEMIQADLRGERQISVDMAEQEYAGQRNAQVSGELETAARAIGFDTAGLGEPQVAAALKRIDRRRVLAGMRRETFDAKREARAVRAAMELDLSGVPDAVLDELEMLAQEGKAASNRDYIDALLAGLENENATQEDRPEESRAGSGRNAGTAQGGPPAGNPDGQGNAAGTQAQEGLTAPTAADIIAQQERAEQGERESKAADKTAEQQDKKAKEQREIQSRQDASAENFQLGQSADEGLSGQTDIFNATPAQPGLQRMQQAKAAREAERGGAPKDTDKGTMLYSRTKEDAANSASGIRVFDRFARFGNEPGSAQGGLRDAASMLNLGANPGLARADKNLSAQTPAGVDLNNFTVHFNPALTFTRAEWAQIMAEELMHKADLVGPRTAMSATSTRLAEGGDIKAEAQKVFDSGKGLADFLRYPLLPEHGLSDERQAAELFARLAVLYHGDQALMQRELPTAYEAYHDLFGTTLLGSGSAVLRDVRSRTGRSAGASGPAGQRPDAAGRPVRRDQVQRANQGLDALRDRIAEIFKADRNGGLIAGEFLETRVIAGATSRQYTAAQQRAMKAVGFDVETPTIKERAQALWQDAGKKLAQGIVDQFAPVKNLDKTAYGLMRLAKGASGAFEVFLRGGKLKLTDGVYDFDDAKKGGVVDRLLIPLQGEHHDFMRWIAANRAERLMAEGKENLFTAQDIADLKTLNGGLLAFDYTVQHGPRAGQTTRNRAEAYRDSQVTFNEFNKNALDLAEQSGLIDGASRKLWEHEFYVPFYRVADDADGGIRGMNIKSGVVRQQAFKQLKGGKDKLNADLLDNTLMNWAHLLDAAAKNRAAKATLEAAERMGVAVSAPESAAREIGTATGNKNGVVWFMDGGQKRFFVVDDPYVMTAISALEYAGMRNPVMNAMGAFKHALTMGVTASPFFKVRNLIRDSVQVIGTGNISFNPGKNLAQGWKLTNPKSDAYFKLLAGGGTIHFGTMLEGSEAKRVQALVESGVQDSTILNSDDKVKAFYRKFIEPGITAYNELGNRGEAINRAALYKQLTDQGVSHADASLQARDLMDFSMQGSFTTIRFLAQVVPFFNARLQGSYKLGRAAVENPARFGAVLGATALFSLALLAAYGDDDDWKKREEWDRNNFWWFKFGGTAFRIPKPFEIGAIATLAERGAELFFDDEMTGKRFRQQVMELLSNNLSMNPVPQLVKPIVDVYANKDSFSGRPIETMGMERIKSEYRFHARTSMLARGASTAMNSVTGLVGADAPSPVQIDHMIRGYFGWLGSFIVGASDVLARPATGQPGHAAPDYWKAATGGMVSELEGAPSRYVSQMYDQAKEVEQAYGTWRALQKEGKSEEAQAFGAEHQGELNQYRKVGGLKRMVSGLNEQIKIVERSDLSGDEKRQKIRVLQEKKDRLARVLAPA